MLTSSLHRRENDAQLFELCALDTERGNLKKSAMDT